MRAAFPFRSPQLYSYLGAKIRQDQGVGVGVSVPHFGSLGAKSEEEKKKAGDWIGKRVRFLINSGRCGASFSSFLFERSICSYSVFRKKSVQKDRET